MTASSDLSDVTNSVNTGEKTYAIKTPAGTEIKGVPQGPRGNHNFMLKYTDLALLDNTQLTIDLYKQTIHLLILKNTQLNGNLLYQKKILIN